MCNDKERTLAIEKAKSLYEKWGSYSVPGELLGINPAHIWKAVNQGYASPMLIKMMGIKEPRVRISADVTPEQREALHALAASHGLTWSAYCRRLADEFVT